MIGRILRLPPVLSLLVIGGASIVQARFPAALGISSFQAGIALGLTVLLVAVTVAGGALFTMNRHRTTAEPGRRPSSLVTGGVFAFTRNPLYLSMLMVVLGIGVMVDGAWFVVASVTLGVLLDRIVIRSEERVLEEVFANEYLSYKGRVRRWL